MCWICGIEGLNKADDRKKAEDFIRKSFSHDGSVQSFCTCAAPGYIVEGLVEFSTNIDDEFTLALCDGVSSTLDDFFTIQKGKVINIWSESV